MASVRARAEPECNQTQTDGEFSAFLMAYPFNQTMDVEAPEAAFETLSIEDRLKAIRFAKLYGADIKAQNRSHPLSAVKWLRQRKFDEAERIASAKGQGAALKATHVFVVKEADAWHKWVSHHMKTKGKPPPGHFRMATKPAGGSGACFRRGLRPILRRHPRARQRRRIWLGPSRAAVCSTTSHRLAAWPDC